MLTNQEIVNCYNNIIKQVCCDYPESEYPDCCWDPCYVAKEPLSQFQWDNLVKVCSIIKSNSKRFFMETWHGKKHSCGTSHCIAGWAASLLLSDPNLLEDTPTLSEIDNADFSEYIQSTYDILESEVPYVVGIASIGRYMLSDTIEKFFYLTRDSFGISNDEYDIEYIIMREFIDVVLERAKEESHELSSEFIKFVESINTQPCEVAV